MSPLICMLLSASNRFGYNTDWFLIEMQRSGCSLTILLPLSFCVCVLFFLHIPLLISVPLFCLSQSLLASSPFCVHFFLSFFPLFCMLLLSLAWNGDWKPPKVWRNCKSQKQPAQQPCKSTRNFLWKGRERGKRKESRGWICGLCALLVLRWTHCCLNCFCTVSLTRTINFLYLNLHLLSLFAQLCILYMCINALRLHVLKSTDVSKYFCYFHF